MGFTRRIQDPKTGNWMWVTTYLRNGKLVTARLPPHLFREGLTPRRLEVIADFTEIAAKGFGKKQTGHLPPAAEEVQRELPRKRRAMKDTSQ
jgi:hypothetical protein